MQRRQPSAGVSPQAGFTPDWLRSEYVEKGRSFDDLGAEAGCSATTLLTWAKRWEVPIRPRGTAGNQAAARARLDAAAAAEKNPKSAVPAPAFSRPGKRCRPEARVTQVTS